MDDALGLAIRLRSIRPREAVANGPGPTDVYLWSQAELGPDFADFEPIDLTGFKLTAGINYLF